MIVLVTTSTTLLEQYRQFLQPFGMIIAVGDDTALRGAMAKLKPRYLFIDMALSTLSSPECIAQLRALSPMTKLVGFGYALHEDQEVELFCAGLRAYCSNETDYPQFKKMMMTLERGEVWISRPTMARLISKLHTAPPALAKPAMHVVPDALWTLTQREKEIALLVAQGKNNRQIAIALQISERTVKSHLTEIFRKFGLSDRLALALRLTALPSPNASPQPLATTKVIVDSDTLGLTA